MEPQLPKQTSYNRARRARFIHRFISVAIGLAIALSVVSVVVAYALSESTINEVHQIESTLLVLGPVTGDVKRGERLVKGVLRCTECHEKDLGGKVIVDTEIGRVSSPNLTRGSGGIGASLTQSDWVRALRHGVGRDGHGLWMMPVDRFKSLTDQDLADVIAYMATVAPVGRHTEESKLGILGRFVHALGKLTLMNPRLERADESVGPFTTAVARGRHLSLLAGCRSCHGAELRGGDDYLGSDLVNGPFSRWSFDAFRKAMRQGIRPNSETMPDEMPWPEFGRMSDEELQDLFSYLRSLASEG